MKSLLFVAVLLMLLCQEGWTKSVKREATTEGTTEGITEGYGWEYEGMVLDIEERLMDDGEHIAVSLSFNGESAVYTGEKQPAEAQTPGEGVEAAELDACVRTLFNDKGELIQLYDGCTYFSGGILETDDGFYELDITDRGGKKKALLKKVARTVELKKKMTDKEPPMNPDYAQWLNENQGSSPVEKREASETHLIEVGVLGDFSFYERMGKDAKKINEFLAIAIPLMKTGLEKLPNTKIKIASKTYYKTNPTWMANAALTEDYLNKMNQNAAAAAGIDSSKVDVWMHITGRDFLQGETGVLGWASEIGDTCKDVSGSINEIGNGGAVGSKEDAWALADIAVHEVGHNLGFIHDFETDNSRSPPTCTAADDSTGNQRRGAMHYNALDWLKKRLETNKKVWSDCTLSNWANFLKSIKAQGKYCFTGASQPPSTTAAPPPPSGECGNCGKQHGGTGCTVSAVKTCVCGKDSYCCSAEWDSICVNLAYEQCSLSASCKQAATAAPTTPAPTAPPAAECGNCGQEHGGKGCTVAATKTCVCNADSYCCDTQWDSLCVEAAYSTCSLSQSCKG